MAETDYIFTAHQTGGSSAIIKENLPPVGEISSYDRYNLDQPLGTTILPGRNDYYLVGVKAPESDLRARLRAKDNYHANNLIYTGPATMLKSTGGLVWPYNPTITYSQEVLYSSMDIVHTNQEILSYTRTPATKLAVTGQFSAQTQSEGLYCLACIHFLRTVTKMSFGSTVDPQPGTPPPILLFDAHGAGMFKNLPVVVTSFSIGLPNEPDYLSVAVPGTDQPTRVPAIFDVTVNITVQNTPQNLRKWSLDKFRVGGYLKSGGYI